MQGVTLRIVEATLTFEDHIARNRHRSFLLILSLALFGGIVGGVLSAAIFQDPAIGVSGGLIALGGAALVAAVIYYFGPNLLMGISGAKPITRDDDLELFNVVEEMAIAAGVPTPKLYQIEDTAMNAFATGRDPERAVIAITSGLRCKLSRDELQGVIAHEMAHIVNFDIRLMMLIAGVAGLIVLLCDTFWRILRSPKTRRRSSRSSFGGVKVILFLLAMILALIAPVIAKLLQLAVSREREYLADATAVRLTRNPVGLAGALRKLADDTEPLEAANRATEHLYIVSPTRKLSAADLDSVWSTHPPVQRRIERLLALAA